MQYLVVFNFSNFVVLIGVPLEVFININVNDISSISEVKMVSLLWLFDPLSF